MTLMRCTFTYGFLFCFYSQISGNGDDRISLGIGVMVANVLYLLLYVQATPTNNSSEISYVGKLHR